MNRLNFLEDAINRLVETSKKTNHEMSELRASHVRLSGAAEKLILKIDSLFSLKRGL